MHVFAFDWGWTVQDASHPDHEGVPINWIRVLREDSNCRVFALSERLTAELDVQGPESVLAGDEGDSSERRAMLKRLRSQHPEAESFTVVDDIDLSDVPGWRHYTGWEFVTAGRAGDLPVTLLPPEEG